jgi:hypothetical protein
LKKGLGIILDSLSCIRNPLFRKVPVRYNRAMQGNPKGSELNSQAALRLIHFEDCRAAIDDLFLQALKTDKSTAFDSFLDFV